MIYETNKWDYHQLPLTVEIDSFTYMVENGVVFDPGTTAVLRVIDVSMEVKVREEK